MSRRFRKRVLCAVSVYKELLDSNHINAENINVVVMEFGISRNSLQDGFKESYGLGIREYKLKVKMELAQQMITEGKDVKEIALTLHYKNSGNFSAAFKKRYGYTPTEMVS